MKNFFQFVFLGIVLSCFFSILNCGTVDESSTGALLKFPYAIDGGLYNISWLVAPAQFGFHDYGGHMEGYLVLPANESYHTECVSEAYNSNPYVHWLTDWEVEEGSTPSWILLIDRGSCYFVNKIYNAQLLGASAVIVLDNKDENLFTMWEPDYYTSNISIPSVLLGYNHSAILMRSLGVQNWNPNQISETVYPQPEVMNWSIAKIEWGLPHYDDRVEWELWSSSNDPDSITFKKNFRNTSLQLSQANDTVFTPHMYIIDGSHSGCQSSSLPCGKKCTNTGRYCQTSSSGVNGMTVVQEDLRQLCLWNYTQTYNLGEKYWWDYNLLWNQNCYNGTLNSKTFTESCSFQQMDAIDSNLSIFVNACINATGGYGQHDGVNTILQSEINLREKSSVYAIPMVIVNQFMIHGDIDCDVVTTQECQVLDAICAGFINGTQPQLCSVTPAPTPTTCNSNRKDCAGVCYGSHQTDSCGQCLLISSSSWNDCLGCDGVPYSNKTYDCTGVCGGNMAINDCGYCILSNLTNFSSYGQDCSGTCNGNKIWDRCGQCLTETNVLFDSCVGCDGTSNSGKSENPCGYCIPTSYANFSTYGQDCSGTCNGDKIIDRCGHCLSESDSLFDSCIGCDEKADNYTINPCGFCLPSNFSTFLTYGLDCRGKCDTSGLYQYDDCGNCTKINGNSWNSCAGCDGVAYSNYTWICGRCLALNSYEYQHACDQQQNLTTHNNNNFSLTGTTLIIVIIAIIVVLLIILIGGFCIHRLWKRQQDVDKSFKSILQNYQVMEETKASKKTRSNKQYDTVADEDNL